MLVNGAKKRDDVILLLDVLGEVNGKYYTYVSTFKRFVWNIRDSSGQVNYGYRYIGDNSELALRSSCTSIGEAILRHQVSSAKPLYKKIYNVIGIDFYSLEHLMKCFKEVAT